VADTKFDIGDNLTKVLIALVGVAMVVAQVWTGIRANDAARSSSENAHRLGQVERNVIEGRNDHRRSVGLPPIPVPDTMTE
jgi:hypothetical protein